MNKTAICLAGGEDSCSRRGQALASNDSVSTYDPGTACETVVLRDTRVLLDVGFPLPVSAWPIDGLLVRGFAIDGVQVDVFLVDGFSTLVLVVEASPILRAPGVCIFGQYG